MNKEELEQTVYNISRELQTNFAIDELCALEQEIDILNNIISEVNRVLKSILFELDQTGEAEQVIEKIEYCVKQLKEKE